MINCFKTRSTLTSLLLLAACGGAGGGDAPVVQPSPFAEPGGAGDVTLAAATLDSGARTTATETGTLNEATQVLAFGALSGALDADGESGTLDGGGLITITPGTTDFAARFVAEPQGANRLIGIVGLESAASDLPGGTATYTGTSEVTVLDGTRIFALTGDATIAADFGAGSVQTTVDNLNGTLTAGAAAPASVSDVATIVFSGSDIAEAQFSGGTVDITSATLSGLSGSEAASLNGAFYGPGADEAGATFIIDDSANDGVTVFGTALAD